MLYFTESHPTLPDIMQVNADFEQNYDAGEYEDKIAQLLKEARDRDGRDSPDREREWEDALEVLKSEDHYILVMVRQAFGTRLKGVSGRANRVRDFIIYVVIGLAIISILVAAAWRNY